MTSTDTTLRSSAHNPEDDLAFIRRILEESRAHLAEDGKPYILWGIIVSLGMLASYISSITSRGENLVGWLWIGLSAIGWGYATYSVRKSKRPERVRTIVDRVQGSLWGATGITIGLVITLVYTCNLFDDQISIHPLFICPIVALMLGIAYYVSGAVLQIRWLQNVAFGWWLGGIAMFYYHSVHVLLIYALMLIVFQVIPGVVLYRSYRRQLVGMSALPTT